MAHLGGRRGWGHQQEEQEQQERTTEVVRHHRSKRMAPAKATQTKSETDSRNLAKSRFLTFSIFEQWWLKLNIGIQAIVHRQKISLTFPGLFLLCRQIHHNLVFWTAGMKMEMEFEKSMTGGGQSKYLLHVIMNTWRAWRILIIHWGGAVGVFRFLKNRVTNACCPICRSIRCRAVTRPFLLYRQSPIPAIKKKCPPLNKRLRFGKRKTVRFTRNHKFEFKQSNDRFKEIRVIDCTLEMASLPRSHFDWFGYLWSYSCCCCCCSMAIIRTRDWRIGFRAFRESRALSTTRWWSTEYSRRQ